jgi:peptide/nickel transport system substrate-binding protein
MITYARLTLLVIAACAAGQSAWAQTAKAEAPALAAQVKEGKLPALAARMPKTPLVIKPSERVGTYGGVWRSAVRGTSDQSYIRRLVNYDSFVRYDAEAKKFVPNLAESWTIAADDKSYTFKLREGIKWSDGAPFTTSDIMYWYAAKSQKLSTSNRLDLGTCAPQAETAYVIKFVCSQPFGMLLENMASPGGDELVSYPQHFMRQFHQATANPDALKKMMAETKMAKWENLFDFRGDSYMTPGKPTLAAWRVLEPYTGTRVIFERNPYYWKIDTAGNQLPYLDRVSFEVAQDNEVLLLKGLNGEFDFHTRHFNTLANKAVVFQNKERGKYDIVDLTTTDANYMAVHLNLSHADPARRALFGKKDLRIGLSHAINRKEIIDLVFLGAGVPWQSAPRKESPFYHERLATQYTEYSVAKANEFLDKAGVAKDASGQRMADGKPLSIRVLVRADRPEMQQSMQLIQKHWAAVGVKLDMDVIERSLFRQRYRGNQHDAAADDVEVGGADFMSNPDSYVPMDNTSYYGTGWFYWLEGRRGDPKAHIEPPAQVKRAYDLFVQATQVSEPVTRVRLIREMLDIAADQYYSIGIASPAELYGVVSRKMRNVPRKQLDSFSLAFPGPYAPEQFFIQK